jgi:peptidoglycan hydrolase-like protein with peptidoglycan-binding domain
MLLRKGRSNDKDQVKTLQAGLAYFGFHPGSADGIFGQKTEDAIEAWQTKVGLYPDGIFGDGSMAAWNTYCEQKGKPGFFFGTPSVATDPVEADAAKLTWVRCKATPMPNGHGYKSLKLRSDAAVAYNKLLNAVEALGGYLTTAGGKRGLGGKANASRSKKSFHYTGRAFDLATYSGMSNPATDPFIVVRNGERNWTVWVKVGVADPSVPEVTLQATVAKSIKRANGTRYTQLSVVEWTGQAVNFTQMAGFSGFRSIRGRKSFFKGGSYMGAEWWHFQWEEGLVKGESTFGEELLKVYTLAQCKAFAYWDEAKDAVFGVSWG